MEEKIAMISIAITNREESFEKVNKILHDFGDNILLRVGYPMKKENIAIIFIIFKSNTDLIGALNGKLGQVSGVKVKSHILKY
ncbi:TM1266 family iron-only hydrogenase system putative regulator [Oceanotoga teriensis]|uniref:Iron-only hydrogenase system regulator n=1 Tax=Oceanotoga teriensis TaxID=515440 RepID=A0AA45C4Z3_9BACT|nr:TM1266 family iron-only hydrogenase system putative regulator [Oceanotoga teriensis]MDO7977671.1 iron-only hydrogenase system regulator [Oceanotoga teriensis]PWJ87550.1 putative iron-only hydrogenase system regulator [Oceanotoga teriensis]